MPQKKTSSRSSRVAMQQTSMFDAFDHSCHSSPARNERLASSSDESADVLAEPPAAQELPLAQEAPVLESSDDSVAVSTDPVVLVTIGEPNTKMFCPDNRPSKSPKRKARYSASTLPLLGTHDCGNREIDKQTYFRILNDLTSVSDQQALRDLWKLSEAMGVNVASLKLTQKSLEAMLTAHHDGNLPSRRARQILLAITRAAKGVAALSILDYEAAEDSRIKQIPYGELPYAYRQDLARFVRNTPVKVKGTANVAGALSKKTFESYIGSAGTALAALEKSGIPIGPEIGIAFMVDPEVVEVWVRFIKEHSPLSLPSILAALTKIARTLPEANDAMIRNLRGKYAGVLAAVTLDAEDSANLDAMAQPENLVRLYAVPQKMMSSALENELSKARRLRLASAAMAFLLMLEHPSLNEKQIASFDVNRDVSDEAGSHFVVVSDPDERSARRQIEPMSGRLAALLAQLSALWTSLEKTSTLLSPDRFGKPGRVSTVMERHYIEIRTALSREDVGAPTGGITRSMFRDLNVFIGVDCPNPDVAAVSKGAGIKNTRSTQRRFRDIIQGPRPAEERP